MVTYEDVQELLEGRGRGAGEHYEYPVFTVVLERFMEERGIDAYSDLYEKFTEAGYELDYETFIDICDGREGMHIQFAQGVPHVLGLDKQEKLAFAWANLWGATRSVGKPTGPGSFGASAHFVPFTGQIV